MCEPLTNTQIKTAEMSGAGLDAVGSFINAVSARKQAKYAAALAEMRAHDARSRGGSEAAKRLGKGVRQASEIRTNIAARGLDVREGTAARLQDDATLLARIDANTIRENAEKEAYGHENMAAQYRHQAASINPFLSATGTLIGNVGTLSHRWALREKAGVE